MHHNKSETKIGKKAFNIYADLKEKLSIGYYPSGSHLPKEVELCEMYSVSLYSVRKALKSLIDDNLIFARQGSGYIVKKVIHNQSLKHAVALMIEKQNDCFYDLQYQALNQGYILTTFSQLSHRWDLALERKFLESIIKEKYCGVIGYLTPVKPTNLELLKQMEDNKVRVVHTDCYDTILPNSNYIIPDYLKAGEMAVSFFCEAGFDNYCYLGMATDWPAAKMVKQGFINGLNNLGTTCQSEVNYFEFPKGISDSPENTQLVKDFVTKTAQCNKKTAFLCRSYTTAMSVLSICRELGISVPGQIGIMTSQYTSLTHISTSIDTLVYDHQNTLSNAFDFIINRKRRALKELLNPSIMINGSVNGQ